MINFPIILALLFGTTLLLGASSKSKNRFFNAVTHGQCATVESILSAKPQLAEQSDAIVWAVSWNQRPICELLIQHGCDLRTRSAALLRVATNHAEMVRFLIEKGADAKAVASDGFTPLHAAAVQGNVESLQILHDHGANLETVFELWHATPLLCAACCGQLETIDLLLSLGANPNAVDIANGLPRWKAPVVQSERLKACEERIRKAQRSKRASHV